MALVKCCICQKGALDTVLRRLSLFSLLNLEGRFSLPYFILNVNCLFLVLLNHYVNFYIFIKGS